MMAPEQETGAQGMLHLCPQNTSCMIPPCPSQPRLHMSLGNPRSAARSQTSHLAANQPGFYPWEPRASSWLRLPHRIATNRWVSCIGCRMSYPSPLLLHQGLDRLLQKRELAMDWIVDEFGHRCTHPTDGETMCSELQIASCLACKNGQIQIVTVSTYKIILFGTLSQLVSNLRYIQNNIFSRLTFFHGKVSLMTLMIWKSDITLIMEYIF